MLHNTSTLRRRLWARRGLGVVAAAALAAPGAAAQGAGTIVFARALGGADRLEAVSADGTGLRELARAPRLDDPAWAPDGTRIAVAGPAGLELVDAATGVRTAVTRSRADADPAWSPDGTRLVFVRSVRRNQDVYVLTLSDGAVARLTSSRARDQEPVWSPDGTTIAFTSRRARNWELYLMDANGRRERRLTRTGTAEGFPAWSPDGRSLSFWRRTSRGVRVFALTGGRVRRLTSGPGNDYDAAWSPDGARIAFVSDRDGRPQVFVAAAREGGAATAVTPAGGFATAPSWQPGLR